MENNTTRFEGPFLLLSSVSAFNCLLSNNNNISELDDEWEKDIQLVDDDIKNVCFHANRGTYGENCVVADKNGRILFELFETGKWEYYE